MSTSCSQLGAGPGACQCHEWCPPRPRTVRTRRQTVRGRRTLAERARDPRGVGAGPSRRGRRTLAACAHNAVSVATQQAGYVDLSAQKKTVHFAQAPSVGPVTGADDARRRGFAAASQHEPPCLMRTVFTRRCGRPHAAPTGSTLRSPRRQTQPPMRGRPRGHFQDAPVTRRMHIRRTKGSPPAGHVTAVGRRA